VIHSERRNVLDAKAYEHLEEDLEKRAREEAELPRLRVVEPVCARRAVPHDVEDYVREYEHVEQPHRYEDDEPAADELLIETDCDENEEGEDEEPGEQRAIVDCHLCVIHRHYHSTSSLNHSSVASRTSLRDNLV